MSKRNTVLAVPLDTDPRSHIPTSEAAAHLGRKPQTLRVWAAYKTGPILPVSVGGRLLWPVAGIMALLQRGDQKEGGDTVA